MMTHPGWWITRAPARALRGLHCVVACALRVCHSQSDYAVCNSERAVFVVTVHTPRWRFFSRQPKPVLTMKKNHHLSGLEEC